MIGVALTKHLILFYLDSFTIPLFFYLHAPNININININSSGKQARDKTLKESGR